jgi:hypothetical protein
MAETRNIPIKFLANDGGDARHEKAINQFASIINVSQYGTLTLAEMLNTKTCEPEYIIAATWTDPLTKDEKFLPVAKQLTGDIVDGLYALPDGEGGWVGVVNSLEEALEEPSGEKVTDD